MVQVGSGIINQISITKHTNSEWKRNQMEIKSKVICTPYTLGLVQDHFVNKFSLKLNNIKLKGRRGDIFADSSH